MDTITLLTENCQFFFNFKRRFIVDIRHVLPAHACVLQLWLVYVDPEHDAPPLDGEGFVHDLYLYCFPPPHVFEHVPHLPQAVHPPFTEKNGFKY